MSTEISLNLLNFRTAKGIPQKQAAKDLGISQSLLSHYEKGIRECGLNFLIKAADYYEVSCDRLLGRKSATESDENEAVTNDLRVILACIKSLSEVSPAVKEAAEHKISLFSYNLLRRTCQTTSVNDDELFSVDKRVVDPLCDAVSNLNTTALLLGIRRRSPKPRPEEIFGDAMPSIKALTKKTEELINIASY